jgi:hypothetical protein
MGLEILPDQFFRKAKPIELRRINQAHPTPQRSLIYSPEVFLLVAFSKAPDQPIAPLPGAKTKRGNGLITRILGHSVT